MLAGVAGNELKCRWFLDEPHHGDRYGHRLRLALQPSVALQKALSALLAPVGKLMDYMAKSEQFPEGLQTGRFWGFRTRSFYMSGGRRPK
jgi:hypothetical protein